MKEAVLKLLPAIIGVAAGVMLAFIDPHIIIMLIAAHALGLISGIVLRRFSAAAIFVAGMAAGMIALYTWLMGSALGGGGEIIGFGFGCLYGTATGLVALLGAAIGHAAIKKNL